MAYVQRKRTKGFRLPPGAISCTRPGPYANPFRIGGYFMVGDPGARRTPLQMAWCERVIWEPADIDRAIGEGFTLIKDAEQSVELYRRYVAGWHPEKRIKVIRELSGHDLACWCREGAPCHVQDVLIPMTE